MIAMKSRIVLNVPFRQFGSWRCESFCLFEIWQESVKVPTRTPKLFPAIIIRLRSTIVNHTIENCSPSNDFSSWRCYGTVLQCRLRYAGKVPVIFRPWRSNSHTWDVTAGDEGNGDEVFLLITGLL